MRKDQVDLVNALGWIPDSKDSQRGRGGAARRNG
jgi:hypothetical protein